MTNNQELKRKGQHSFVATSLRLSMQCLVLGVAMMAGGLRMNAEQLQKECSSECFHSAQIDPRSPTPIGLAA